MSDKITKLPLKYIKGHIFVQIDDGLWLIDTGSPNSFGTAGSLAIGDKKFTLDKKYCNFNSLTAGILSQFIGIPCLGLIGMDILRCFDIIFDIADGTIVLSASKIKYDGKGVPVEHFMSIPLFTVQINGIDYRMIFDTGAQISFFQHESRVNFPVAGEFTEKLCFNISGKSDTLA